MKEILKQIKSNLGEFEKYKSNLDSYEKEKKEINDQIKTLKAEKDLMDIFSPVLKIKQQEIDDAERKQKNLNNKSKLYYEEVKNDINTKKTEMKKTLEDEMAKYKSKDEVEEIKKEVKEFELKKRECEKKALEAQQKYQKEMDNLIFKTDAEKDEIIKNIFNLNEEKNKNIRLAEDAAKQISSKKEEINNYIAIEDNIEDYNNLDYLLANVNSFDLHYIDKFENMVNSIANKYDLEEKTIDLDEFLENNNTEEKKEPEEEPEEEIEEEPEKEIEEEPEEELEEQPEENIDANTITINPSRATPQMDGNIKFTQPKIEENNFNIKAEHAEPENAPETAEQIIQKPENNEKTIGKDEKIEVKIKDGMIQIEYDNENLKALRGNLYGSFFTKYNPKEFKDKLATLIRNGFKFENKFIDIQAFSKKAKQKIEPFLISFLQENNGELGLKILESIKNGKGLEEFKDIISYDMFGAKECGFFDKLKLGKIAKIAKQNNLPVENVDATKTAITKVIGKIGDFFKFKKEQKTFEKNAKVEALGPAVDSEKIDAVKIGDKQEATTHVYENNFKQYDNEFNRLGISKTQHENFLAKLKAKDKPKEPTLEEIKDQERLKRMITEAKNKVDANKRNNQNNVNHNKNNAKENNNEENNIEEKEI